jgi:hypothetical protein
MGTVKKVSMLTSQQVDCLFGSSLIFSACIAYVFVSLWTGDWHWITKSF